MGCCVCVEQSKVGMRESMGKFDEVLAPGCHCLNPFSQSLSGTITLKTSLLNTMVSSRTQDNTMIGVKVCTMYRVDPSQVHVAFYRLANPVQQIGNYVTNYVRQMVPTKTLNQMFEERQELSQKMERELNEQLSQFGYAIVDMLILDITPPRDVVEGMNQQMARRFNRDAAGHKAAVEKLTLIKHAEGEAEAKRLTGVGLAEQRKAIMGGMGQNLTMFEEQQDNLGSKNKIPETEVMAMILMLQYFDMTSDITKGTVKPVTYFMPPSQRGKYKRFDLVGRGGDDDL